jgi:hypothetical protein
MSQDAFSFANSKKCKWHMMHKVSPKLKLKYIAVVLIVGSLLHSAAACSECVRDCVSCAQLPGVPCWCSEKSWRSDGDIIIAKGCYAGDCTSCPGKYTISRSLDSVRSCVWDRDKQNRNTWMLVGSIAGGILYNFNWILVLAY